MLFKRGEILNKDKSKPISFKTIQKNTKLAEFSEDNKEIESEEQNTS